MAIAGKPAIGSETGRGLTLGDLNFPCFWVDLGDLSTTLFPYIHRKDPFCFSLRSVIIFTLSAESKHAEDSFRLCVSSDG